MSKVILVMDKMPEDCYRCIFMDGDNEVCIIEQRSVPCDDRPYWCPLKEMPEHKDEIPISILQIEKEIHESGVRAGWNMCRMAIGGGEE